MAGMNVGLISGMDTKTLISQLMQVEANPQTLLKIKLAGTKADADAYRAVNTRFDALRTAAEALTRTATWTAATATSSSAAVTATSSTSASSGSLTFAVTQLASTHSVLSAKSWAQPSDALDLASPFSITDAGGDSHEIVMDGSPTLAEAVTAINAGGWGVTAAAVSTSSGYRLQVTSTTTGAASSFSLGDTDEFPTLTAGTNAEIQVGDPATVGYTATSATNTFSDLMPGTTLTVSQIGSATVTVASDPESLTTAVQALVTAANDVLSSIHGFTNSSAGAGDKTAVLKGDSSLRRLSSQVLEAVAGAIGGTASAATAGIQLDRYGKLAFNADTFTAALKSDPDLVQRLVSGTAAAPGVAERLVTLAGRATDSTTGTLALVAKGQDALATDLQKRIDDWDLRLAQRRQTITRQFTAMETMLGTLQSQSSWLSSQLSSLPSWSSSSK